MTAMPGGGVNDAASDPSYQSALKLEGNPAKAQIGAERALAEQGIQGQNLQLQQGDLMNNMQLMEMLNSLLGGSAGYLSQLGAYPPSLRGQAKGVAASGTSSGGSTGLFGF